MAPAPPMRPCSCRSTGRRLCLAKQGRIKHVAVSNRGEGMSPEPQLSDKVAALLQPAAEELGLEIQTLKADAIEDADAAGNAFMSLFTTFGTFSIAAGILLIFLIFVMLAAERRSELGIARAVGTRRGHLVQMFMFEGVAYDLAAAVVGAALGALVALGMVIVMASAFARRRRGRGPPDRVRRLGAQPRDRFRSRGCC